MDGTKDDLLFCDSVDEDPFKGFCENEVQECSMLADNLPTPNALLCLIPKNTVSLKGRRIWRITLMMTQDHRTTDINIK